MSDPTSDPRPVRTAVSATTTLSAVVAVIAVVLGFLILKDLNDSGGSSTPVGPAVTTTVALATTTTTTPAQTTTTLLTTGFEVLVANGSGVSGSAGKLTDQLTGKGFVMVPATNKPVAMPTQTDTVVYYLPGFEEAANSVASVLGGVATQEMPEAVPTEDGEMGSASVLVLLGTDQAGKKLPKRA